MRHTACSAGSASSAGPLGTSQTSNEEPVEAARLGKRKMETALGTAVAVDMEDLQEESKGVLVKIKDIYGVRCGQSSNASPSARPVPLLTPRSRRMVAHHGARTVLRSAPGSSSPYYKYM